MHRDHHVVVVGCGDLGASALYHLARAHGGRAGAVVGLDTAAGAVPGAGTPEGRGGGHVLDAGAPAPHAGLAPAARDTLADVERISGQQLLTRTGALVVEDPRAPAADGTLDAHRAAAARRGVRVRELDAREVTARWGTLRLGDGPRALHRPDAVLVDAHRARATHLALARARGAEVRDATTVRELRPRADGVEVVTDDEVLHAAHVVVTADVRVTEVLAGLGRDLSLAVRQDDLVSYATGDLLDFSPGVFPVLDWHGAEEFTALPVHGDVTTTLARRVRAGEHPDDPLRAGRHREFLDAHLPRFGGPVVRRRTVLSTLTPDRRPVAGTVPEAPGVHVGVGVPPAYAPLVGRMLADLATAGRSRHDAAGVLGLDRPGLRGARRPV